jgi:hypothetical protein
VRSGRWTKGENRLHPVDQGCRQSGVRNRPGGPGQVCSSRPVVMNKTECVVEVPDTSVVRLVLRKLEEGNLGAAIGGSGLLAALGLTDVVHDWDITTDGPISAVEDALKSTGAPYRQTPSGIGIYASDGLYVVDGGDHDIDVIVGFAVRVGNRKIELPTRISETWQGLPLADPTVWEQAYRLIGEHSKADLLSQWLQEFDSAR